MNILIRGIGKDSLDIPLKPNLHVGQSPFVDSDTASGANLVLHQFSFDLAASHPDALQPLRRDLYRDQRHFCRCRRRGSGRRILREGIRRLGSRIPRRFRCPRMKPQGNEKYREHGVSNQCQQEPCAIGFHLFAPSPRNDSPVSCSICASAVSRSAMLLQYSSSKWRTSRNEVSSAGKS